jgi:uncharacterized membrane protein YgcG
VRHLLRHCQWRLHAEDGGSWVRVRVMRMLLVVVLMVLVVLVVLHLLLLPLLLHLALYVLLPAGPLLGEEVQQGPLPLLVHEQRPPSYEVEVALPVRVQVQGRPVTEGVHGQRDGGRGGQRGQRGGEGGGGGGGRGGSASASASGRGRRCA